MNRKALVAIFILAALFLVNVGVARSDNLYGTIRGTITDASGGTLPEVKVTATNMATNVAQEVTTQANGTFTFLELLVGDYSLKAEKTGFQTYAVAKIHLDVGTNYVQDITMTLGAVTSQVTVEATAVQVETTTTQLGAVVDSNQIVNMPLIGRNWLQLQQMEPGVVSGSDRFGTGSQAGNFSTNGTQTQFGSYLVDGTDTNDIVLNTQTFNLSPDALNEFQEVTSTINPEFARASGVIVNGVTKSGTNSFHGDGFWFYRDTFLDARNFVSQQVSPYQQNVFGGTIGGPIIKNHTFFFFSYEGLRATQPQVVLSTNVGVYTNAQRGGAFGAGTFASSTNVSPFPLWGDPCPATGAPCPAGTPYATLFASGNIPTQDFNAVSTTLLNKYIPIANACIGGGACSGGFNSYSFNPSVKNKYGQYMFKINQNIGQKDTLWGTWMQEGNPTTETIPFVGTGATIPGFGELDDVHYKFLTVSWTHVLNDRMVNELRAGYNRFNFNAVNPQVPTLPSTVGFQISPQDPAGAGLPVIDVAGLFDIGFSQDAPQPRIDQTYEVVDNFSLNHGAHTLKFGMDIRWWQVWNPFLFQNSGFYNFAGAGTFSTSVPGADFLLGIPDSYAQGSGQVLLDNAQQYYSYIQDAWKIRPNLTLTYGLGWTIDTPMLDKAYDGHGQVTFRAGQQSTVFTNAPLGILYGGDFNADPAGKTHFSDFGPRLGIAYSPNWGGKLTGGPGKTSIRAGFGIYYDRSETEQASQVSASTPPFAVSSLGYGSVGNPGFTNPFASLQNPAVTVANPFPFQFVDNPNIDFATTPGFLPIFTSCCGRVDQDTRDPMVQNWNLTIQRQLDSSTILTLGYVGSSGHKLSVGLPDNLATNITPCLLDPACGVYSQSNASGPGAHPNDFAYNASEYGPIDTTFSIGHSIYNAFQANVNRRLSKGLELTASYTWAHGLDNGSGFENTGFAGGGGAFGTFGYARASNPYCWPRCDWASSSYDARQRLVISYFYQIPGTHKSWWVDRLTNGWTIAGITTFQDGFPLDVRDGAWSSLGCQAAQSDFACWDGPDLVGKVQYTNPRSGTWFLPSAFAAPPAYPTPAAGAVTLPYLYGNLPRNYLKGPGLNNWDFELYKDTQINERVKFELRMEAYNVFNHAQFDPNGILTDFNFGPPFFGSETNNLAPRQMQLAAKIYF